MASLAARYIFKLAANFISVPVYLLMEAILPRALGPAVYGNYSYATALFSQFAGFLDMGTSTCLYNLLARHNKRTALISFYMRVSLLVLCILAGVCLIFLIPGVPGLLMPDVPLYFVPLAALWALFTWGSRVLRSVNDALGETIPSEIWRTLVSLAAVLLLFGLYLCNSLDVATLFLQQYALLAFTALAFWHVCAAYWRRYDLKVGWALPKKRIRHFGKIFFNYSHPLFIQALLSFFMLTAERWLLQWFDGSAQQGFFALSQKVGIACFLFVSAMTPLLMREFSIAWGKGNREGMGLLLTKFAPLLYGLAAYFSCFTLVEADAIVAIFGGSQFAGAILPVQIMALYPIHQSYGQIAGSVFHSSGKTHILRNLTALECVYGLMAAWILIAPSKFGGLNLGATGLAIKTVCTQFVSVNLYLWFAGKIVPFNFARNIFHQFWCVGLFLAMAFLARAIAGQMTNLAMANFIFCGALYSLGIFGLGLLFPAIFGLSRGEIREILTRFLKKRIL